jgi:hypothetical protein
MVPNERNAGKTMVFLTIKVLWYKKALQKIAKGTDDDNCPLMATELQQIARKILEEYDDTH